MNLDDLKIGEIKQILDMFGKPPQKSIYAEFLGNYCVVRSNGEGVHVGRLDGISSDATTVVLIDSIRIHYWSGACSLSQLAMEGTAKPDECRFAMPVDWIGINNVLSIIPCTDQAIKNIKGVKSWKI